MRAMSGVRLPVASCSSIRSTCNARARSVRAGSVASMPAPSRNAGQPLSSTSSEESWPTAPALSYDEPEQAGRVAVLLDDLGLRHITVAGHSSGGYVATALVGK